MAKRYRRASDVKPPLEKSRTPRPLVFLRDQLNHDQMVQLADVLEAWALAGTLAPEKVARLAEWAREVREVATEAGEGWKPLQPTKDLPSILVLIGRMRPE
ncbi:MAG: hypothetical protein KF723_14130 [Rhizobiaceae bacterium]|nr:hypothetical protein [Rhizobiaceae bacterium]